TTRQVVAFDVATGAVQWTYHDPTTIGTFRRRRVGLSPDEELVTVQIFDIPLVQDESVAVDAEGNDENPARIVVLRASDGEVVRVLEPGACRFLNAWGNGFSRDGQWFAVFTGTGGCFDDPDADWVTVYDTSTWEEAYRLQIDGAFGEEAVFSEDSSRVLLYGGGRPTELRSFPEMELINRLDESAMAALSPDGQKVVQSFSIVVVSRPLIVDAETGERIGFLESVDDFLSLDPLSFSPDGTKIAATTHGADFVFDAEDGRMLAKLGERGFTFSHSFTEDGSMLLTATETALLLWDLGGGLDELGVPIEPADVEAVWINPNQVADGPNLAVRLLFPDENGEILDSRVVTALLDPETGQVRDQVSGFGVQLPDGRFFVSRQRTGQDGERVIGPVVIWDPASDSFVELTDCAAPESAIDQISEIDCPGGEPFYGANDWFFGSVVAALDGSFFAAESYAPVGSERSIRVWDGETLDVRSEFEVPRSQHVTAAGAGWLGTFDSDLFGWLTVYDVDSGAVLAEPSKATDRPFWVYAVAPDGSLLYAADLEGSVWVFDTFSWETVATWEAHDARHRGLALSPEGTRLVTTGEDDFVKVWDVSRIRDRSSVTEPLPLLDRIPAPFPSDAAWLSADRLAVFLGNDANWLEVSLSIDELVTSARQRLTRGFTEGECANYQIDDPCPTTLEAIQSGSA
ncbi:MAG: WD40 repeat domain-containing protein, partial [Acidimicrobiia bacterium]